AEQGRSQPLNRALKAAQRKRLHALDIDLEQVQSIKAGAALIQPQGWHRYQSPERVTQSFAGGGRRRAVGGMRMRAQLYCSRSIAGSTGDQLDLGKTIELCSAGDQLPVACNRLDGDDATLWTNPGCRKQGEDANVGTD